MTWKQWVFSVLFVLVMSSVGTLANFLPIKNEWLRALAVSVTSGVFIFIVTSFVEYVVTLIRSGDLLTKDREDKKDAPEV